MRKQISLLFLLILFFQCSSCAQVTDKPLSLSDEEKELYKRLTIEKINDFQNGLKQMTSKKLSAEDKRIIIRETADLFIDRGETVVMEVSSKSPVNGEISSKQYPLLTYFNRLCNLPYIRLVIKHQQAWCVFNPRQKGVDSGGNPVYEASATYYQEFIGFRGDSVQYKDITKKTIRVEIPWTKDLEGKKWAVFLGDVSVMESRF